MTRWRMRFGTLLLATWALLPVRVIAIAQTTKPVELILAKQISVPVATLTPEEIAAKLPALKHVPYEKAGFCALLMPFHYTDRTSDKTGDPAEANTLSFLISDDLDWSPASYCNFHAYFIWKQQINVFQVLANEYRPSPIRKECAIWGATHAVGGSLTKTDAGYTAELEIYDRAGTRVDHEKFSNPKPYFELLGDLSEASLKFLGPAPSKELVEHLHESRCTDAASITKLGKIAFLPLHSQEEGQQFDDLLQNESKFSNARSWIATQRMWSRQFNEAQLADQQFRAIDDYLTPIEMRSINYRYCPPRFLSHIPKYRELAKSFWGADSPQVISDDIYFDALSGDYDIALRDNAKRAVQLFPNYYDNDVRVAAYFCEPHSVCPDTDLAAAIQSTALFNKFQTATGSKSGMAIAFANSMISQGRSDIACKGLMTPGLESSPENIVWLISELVDLGQFEKALNIYAQYRNGLNKFASDGALHAATAAALLNRPNLIDDILANQSDVLRKRQVLELVQGYRDVLAGKDIDDRTLQVELDPNNGWLYWRYAMLRAQLDIAKGHDDFYSGVTLYMDTTPGTRPGWVFLDAYARQKKQHPELADFYRSLRWLFPDDPRVKVMIHDWVAREPAQAASHADVDKIQHILADFPAELWTAAGKQAGPDALDAVGHSTTAWTITAAITDLASNHQMKQAHELALRYANYAWQTHDSGQYLWAGHLPYVTVEQPPTTAP